MVVEGTTPQLSIQSVCGTRHLAEVCQELLQEAAIGVDSESDGFYRYPERVCLVQLAAPGRCYLVDTLAIDDMSPLGSMLANRQIQKVLHSAENDIRALDRQWGYRLFNLYDTSIAAHFVGMNLLGLQAVLAEALGVELDKSKKLQRANWGLRPIAEELIAYAAKDVCHLLDLREALSEKVDALGRAEWVREECQRLEDVRYQPPASPEVAYTFIKGSHLLNGRQQAVLRELVVLRERVALERGMPPFQVLSHAALLAMAQDPSADLTKIEGLDQGQGLGLRPRVKGALRRALEGPPMPQQNLFSPRQARPTPAQQELARRLRNWRNQTGKRLALDPALVWPASSLERLAREPHTLEQEIHSPEVRQWQVKEFGPSLMKFIQPSWNRDDLP